MKSVPISRARSSLPRLISTLDPDGVAIEKHGRVIAMLVPHGAQVSSPEIAARQLARLRQAGTESERLNRHLRIGVALLSAAEPAARRMIADAQAQVERWRRDRLCSKDYVTRWTKILSLPRQQLVAEMCGEANGWGNALRQNSPWVNHGPRQGLPAI